MTSFSLQPQGPKKPPIINIGDKWPCKEVGLRSPLELNTTTLAILMFTNLFDVMRAMLLPHAEHTFWPNRHALPQPVMSWYGSSCCRPTWLTRRKSQGKSGFPVIFHPTQHQIAETWQECRKSIYSRCHGSIT